MAGYVWMPVLSNWNISPYPTNEMLQVGFNSGNLSERNQWFFEPDSSLQYGYIKVAYVWTGNNSDYLYPQFGCLMRQAGKNWIFKRLRFINPDFTMYDEINEILTVYHGVHGDFYVSSTAAANWQVTRSAINPDIPIYIGNTFSDAFVSASEAFDDGIWNPSVSYPITYSYTNSTVSGPLGAAVGDTVTVSAVPDVDYGITDQSTQISVTNNDVAVPFTWDATNQRIIFTMPDPS